ncbi:MAG: permease, partial [Polyangiaceae bacterium]|nr:permease [Polyangiaceae bacterium]
AAAFVGLAAPTWTERALSNAHARAWHAPLLSIALIALSLHEMLDGMGLATSGVHHGSEDHALAMAILVHRLPVGIGVWWFVRSRIGARAAAGTLAIMGVATTVGFFSGEAIVRGTSASVIAGIQALVAGALLHVVVGHAHAEHDRDRRPGWRSASALGGLAAVAILACVELIESGAHEPHEHGGLGDTFFGLASSAAPALVAAYVIVALASALLPDVTHRQLRVRGSLRQSLRGLGLGMPTTVCSCGLIPVHQRSIVRGAPPAAAVAFIVASASLGTAAILLSFQLLGWQVAFARLAGAVLLAMLSGLFVGRLVGSKPAPTTPSLPPHDHASDSWRDRLASGFRFGFGATVDHTVPWFLTGLAVATLMAPFVQPEWFAHVPAGLDVPVLAVLGVPAYVCAAGATPMAAMLLHKGVSAGAIVAFLLTGPTTTLAVFGVPAEVYGRRVVLALVVAMTTIAIAIGYAVNAVLPATVAARAHHVLESPATPLGLVALALFGAVVLASLFRQGVRGFVQRVVLTPEPTDQDRVAPLA